MLAMNHNSYRTRASNISLLCGLLSLALLGGCASGVDSTMMDPESGPDEPINGAPTPGSMDETPPIDDTETTTCSAEDGVRYENAVLGANCPGPCCQEQFGNIEASDSPLGHLMGPTIHSIYNDEASENLKSDIPLPEGDVSYYVPLAKHAVAGVLPETAVSCVTDADCQAITGDMQAVCGRRDVNGDGTTYAGDGRSEYEPCLDGSDACLNEGGNGGDLANQSAVPDSIVDERCDATLDDVDLPDEVQCEERTSLCVHAPSWKPRGAGVVPTATDRLIIQGVNMIDTEMTAYLVRVAGPNGEELDNAFRTLAINPVDGKLVVELQNGARCELDGPLTGDCAQFDEQGRQVFARINETTTKGRADGEAIAPIHHYLERENQWLRYHRKPGLVRRSRRSEPVASAQSPYALAEQWDDMVLLDLPDNMAPGTYEIRLGYSVNTWLNALDVARGARTACEEKEKLRQACIENVSNPSFVDQYCGIFAEDCTRDEIFFRLSEDRMNLSNPIFVNIAQRAQEQSFEFKLTDVVPRLSGEANGDEVHLYTMFIKFNPDEVQDGDCAVEANGEAPTGDGCRVGGPFYRRFDSAQENRRLRLDDAYMTRFELKPGDVVNVVTLMLDDDGDAEAIGRALDSGGELTSGLLQSVATLEAGGVVGEVVGGAVDALFGLIEGLVSDVTDGEVISFAVTQYSFDDLVLLTHAAQLGFSGQDLEELTLSSLQNAPSRPMAFQGNSFSISEEITVDDDLAWGKHLETRTYTTTGTDDPGHTYRGRSSYDVNLSITHMR